MNKITYRQVAKVRGSKPILCCLENTLFYAEGHLCVKMLPCVAGMLCMELGISYHNQRGKFLEWWKVPIVAVDSCDPAFDMELVFDPLEAFKIGAFKHIY